MRRFNSGLAVLILAGAGAGANAQIKERIQSFVDAGEIPGAVIQYSCGGRAFGPEAVGYQDVAAKKPMRGSSLTIFCTAAVVVTIASQASGVSVTHA
mgnify:CR=1 FL=1